MITELDQRNAITDLDSLNAAASTSAERDTVVRKDITVDIASALLPRAHALIATANRRLARAGVSEQFVLTERGLTTKSITGAGGVNETVEVMEAVLNCPRIEAGGWEFLAKVEYDAASDAILVRMSPDVEGVEIVPTSMACDHCKKSRDRRKCFIISHPEHGRMQVGASCVAPFLGMSVMGLWWLDGSVEESLNELGFARAPRCVDRDRALALAWVVSEEGRNFHPSSADAGSTRDQVSNVLQPPLWATGEFQREIQEMRELADQVPAETVAAIVASAKTLDPATSYGHNMQAIASAEWVTVKNLGFLVSLVAVYRRLVTEETLGKAGVRQQTEVTRGLFAEVGTKISEVEVVVTKRTSITHDQWGTSAIVVMLTDTGHQLKWMSSSGKAFDLEVGDEVVIEQATIKALDTYNDVDSTLLLRPRLRPATTIEGVDP